MMQIASIWSWEFIGAHFVMARAVARALRAKINSIWIKKSQKMHFWVMCAHHQRARIGARAHKKLKNEIFRSKQIFLRVCIFCIFCIFTELKCFEFFFWSGKISFGQKIFFFPFFLDFSNFKILKLKFHPENKNKTMKMQILLCLHD